MSTAAVRSRAPWWALAVLALAGIHGASLRPVHEHESVPQHDHRHQHQR